MMCSAGLILFRRVGHSFAEALSYAVIVTLMLVSFVFQISLLTGLPWISFLLEVLFLPFALWVILRFRADFLHVVGVLTAFRRAHPICVPVYTIGMLYLGLLTMFIPPDPGSWKTLGQIAVFKESGILSSAAYNPSMIPLIPLNHAVLPYMFLRAHTDIGANLFGLMAYVSIACSTYALARRYAWPPTAMTVALIVLGMPRLVYHAVTPGIEIVPVAAALFCVLAVYRSVERLYAIDLILLLIGIGFTVADGKAGMVFPAIFLGLSWLLLVRRHGAVSLWALIRENRWKTMAALIPLSLFSQVWLILANTGAGGQWMGSHIDGGLQFNNDGLQGAFGNMIRYMLESVHLTLPLERFSHTVLNFSLVQFLEDIHALLPESIGGMTGATESFNIIWAANEHCSWYGPLAFLLVFPALAYAAVRGPRRLKAFAVALWAYFYLVTLIFAWSPGNGYLFSVFFVCGGFSIAFLLPPWRFSLRAKQAVQTVSVILFIYALVFNTAKPLFPLDGTGLESSRLMCEAPFFKTASPVTGKPVTVWSETGWGFDRYVFARRCFGDDRVDRLAVLATAGERVAVVSENADVIYPFVLAGASVRFMAPLPEQKAAATRLPLSGFDYLLCLGKVPKLPADTYQTVEVWNGRGAGAESGAAFLLKKEK